MPQVLIVSRSFGVYLGTCMGMGFWSKLENLEMPEACNFPSADEALRVMQTWDGFLSLPDDMTFPFVEDADQDGYSTLAECCAVEGVEPWPRPELQAPNGHPQANHQHPSL